MTRRRLDRTLRRLYIILGLTLAFSLLAKFADQIPWLDGTGLEELLKDGYEFLRDMSLLIATGGVAYITNIYQKRSGFVASLETEWRGNALYRFCETPETDAVSYLDAFCRISETLDNMRIVYRNVGETDDLIGLYPYAPLHDMRRALQTLDPRKHHDLTPAHRKLVRDAILQSFYALRENFLEELDLEEPVHPLLIHSGRRLKVPGATRRARRRQDRQASRQLKRGERHPDSRRTDIDQLLDELYAREQNGG